MLHLFKVLSTETNEFYFVLVVAETLEEALQDVEDHTCVVTASYGGDHIPRKLQEICGGVLVFNDEGIQVRSAGELQ